MSKLLNKAVEEMVSQQEFKQTEIGKIPKEWGVVRIFDIANVKGGKRVPKGHALVDFKTPYPYLRVVDFRNMGINTGNIKYLLPETHGLIKRYIISSNDVYISIAGTIGLAGLIPGELNGANLTENAAKLCNLRNIAKEFLVYVLNSSIVQNQILALAGKAQQPKLALFRIEKIKLPFPPLPEQQKIAKILSTVDSAIEKTDQAIEKTQRLKKGLMQELLIKGIGHKEFKETEIGKIPKEWEVVRLRDIGSLQYGVTASATKENTGIKFLRITDIKDDGIDWPHAPYCGLKESEFKKYELRLGDVLFARIGATTGKTCFIDKPVKCTFGSYLIRFQPGVKDINTKFLYFYTKSEIYWLQINMSKGGQLKKGLNSKLLGNLKLPLPPLPEQQKIAEILSTVDKRLELLRNKKGKLERVKKGLMNDLLTGRKRVKI